MPKLSVATIVMMTSYVMFCAAVPREKERAGAQDQVLKIHYWHAGLMEITIEKGKLTYVWHTVKEGLTLVQQNMGSYDRHEAVITLAPSDVKLCEDWIAQRHALTLKSPAPVQGRRSYGRAFKSRLSVHAHGESNAVAWHGDHKYSEGQAAAGSLLALAEEIIRKKLP